MKKFLCSAGTALLLCAVSPANPVWPEPFRVSQPDGTTLTLVPHGDERFSWFETTDGYRVVPSEGGGYVYDAPASVPIYNKVYRETADVRAARPDTPGHAGALSSLRFVPAHDAADRGATEREFLENLPRATDAAPATRTTPHKRIGEMKTHEGSPFVPVILVQFADTRFTEADPKAAYEERLCRPATVEEVEAGKGSAYQYFADQSAGRFTPQFVVTGPVTLDGDHAAYGADTDGMRDAGAARMIAEAVEKAGASGAVDDWSVFDNDADGVADAVYVVYAGEGQHALPWETDLVWPHSSRIEESNGTAQPELDGVRFNSYSCSSELTRGEVEGFGTFCHEFSHQLGLPDFYRTDGQTATAFTMGAWSLMDYGSYTDRGYRPIGYRALEKDFLGWNKPRELTEETTVKDWHSTDCGGTGLKIVNDVEPSSEYYMLETIDDRGWNKGAFGHGLLICHVFLRGMDSWNNNTVNNGEPNVSVVGADNDLTLLVTGENDSAYYESLAGDPYPSPDGNDEFTDDSEPASDVQVGFFGLGKPVTHISYDAASGTVSFDFMGGSADNVLTGVPSAPSASSSAPAGYYRTDGTWAGNTLPAVPGIYLRRDADGRTVKIAVGR